jgi:integrase
MKALEVCDDEILALAINLAFSCSLRMGEMLGLTWDCIDISEKSLKENSGSIFINKELQRVNRDTMESSNSKELNLHLPESLNEYKHGAFLNTEE